MASVALLGGLTQTSFFLLKLMPSKSLRPSLDDYFMELLDHVKTRSTCRRRMVGAIITDERGRILATGYNGVPSGTSHCTDNPCEGASDPSGDSSRCLAIHAEQNALLQCRGNLNDARVIYCSLFPCFTCAKMIANTSIKRLVYKEPYADKRGMAILVNSEIRCVRMY